ncbi:hypothetical protein HAHI6034_11080 [Hathewaya histolytica]|uniref:Uncharacterized protein n=1 Tax=Hathewaya histolytica TaxID=1498 RepID=A0A4U9RA12_HATHI|nr:hypothetical protein [Hathewaya histolytica]VTQ88485.1 Uncharacterised protein [Hathewaya histolytica]
MDNLLRLKVINMATSLALQDKSNRALEVVIKECLEEACIRLGISLKELKEKVVKEKNLTEVF